MNAKTLLLVKFKGPKEELQNISTLLAKYEQCGTEELKQFALDSGIEQLRVNFFLDEEHPAKLLEVNNYQDVVTATFAVNPFASYLIIKLMNCIKGSCDCAWYRWGNFGCLASFYDENVDSYTEEVLVCYPDAYNEEEDYNLPTEDEEAYYELDSLEGAITNWCSYNDFEREDQTDEEMLEIMQEANDESDYKVYPFIKSNVNLSLDSQTISKVTITGDVDTIEELYSAATDAIDEHNGSYTAFLENYNEDDDYSGAWQLLDAQISENDDGDSVLELTVYSVFNALSDSDNIDYDIFDSFSYLKDYFSDNNDVDLTINIWQVSDCNLETQCELENDEVDPVGYLCVDAQEEFGKDAKFLMCDYLDNLVDRWCELVNYEGDRQEAEEMLDIINSYSYGKDSTNIKAGIVEDQ